MHVMRMALIYRIMKKRLGMSGWLCIEKNKNSLWGVKSLMDLTPHVLCHMQVGSNKRMVNISHCLDLAIA